MINNFFHPCYRGISVSSLAELYRAIIKASGQLVTAGRLLYVWSERLDSNQRPPAPKAGALPCCATLRDGMFCTQKTLLWQGRPIQRPQGPLLAPGKGTVSCSGQRPADLFHTGRAAAAGGAPLSGKKGAPCAPSVRTGKKRIRNGRPRRWASPFRAHGEEAGGLSPCTAHREEAGACPCPHPGPGHRRGPLAPFRPATAEKSEPPA